MTSVDDKLVALRQLACRTLTHVFSWSQWFVATNLKYHSQIVNLLAGDALDGLSMQLDAAQLDKALDNVNAAENSMAMLKMRVKLSDFLAVPQGKY